MGDVVARLRDQGLVIEYPERCAIAHEIERLREALESFLSRERPTNESQIPPLGAARNYRSML